MRVAVEQEAFDFGAEAQRFASGHSEMGAIVTFTGIVRDVGDGLEAMAVEHYPGMTEKALAAIRKEAMTRWSLTDAMIIHRHEPLRPGEQIMMVATAARHRGDAFQAAEFLMDFLKSRAPFWKKETARDGSAWVAAKDTDEDALDRWADET